MIAGKQRRAEMEALLQEAQADPNHPLNESLKLVSDDAQVAHDIRLRIANAWRKAEQRKADRTAGKKTGIKSRTRGAKA